MRMCRRQRARILLVLVCALGCAQRLSAAEPSLGGFIPFVGIGLTKEFETFDSDPDGTFFIADPSFSWGTSPLGPGSSAYFDLALLDTGAATHILAQAAASAAGFGIQAEGFRGTNFQTIFGASGSIDLRINDPLGVYAAGLANRTGAGTALTMNTAALRGQTSFAMLEAPAAWKLPNIIGLPMAAHHAIHIRNDQPQLFQHQGRTVRTPNIELIDLGSGADEGIVRRTNLKLRPSAGFLQGPFYLQNLDITGGNLNFHDNPLSPSVVDSGAMFIDVDMLNGARSFQDKEFLFDTGADLTVVSQLTAARLGFDVLVDQPDFLLEVEGAGGVSPGVPGFYVDELNIDTVGGSFTLQNVPVAVLDLPNPNDPANTLDGIIGMHLFNGRNLVIDTNPAATPNSVGPRLYIGDPVTETHTWIAPGPAATWNSPGAWSTFGSPGIMWDAQAVNSTSSPKTASVETNSTVYRLTVGGTGSGTMTVQIQDETVLTTYGETLLEAGGIVRLNQGGVLDAQFVNLDGGALVGTGEVRVGTGPITSAVRNLSGCIAPDTLFLPVGEIEIHGDLANLKNGTMAFDLGGTGANQYDVVTVERFAFLGGTLEVSLANIGSGTFKPNVGDMFHIITTREGVVGQFDNVVVPGGFQWNVAYGPDNVVLSVVGLGLSGDFNNDGKVDAADYVVWRNNGGTQQDYNLWRSNFGKTAAAASAMPVAPVPEPATALLLLSGAILATTSRRKMQAHRQTMSPRIAGPPRGPCHLTPLAPCEASTYCAASCRR